MRIADLKPYPAMKDSGLPWLGKVPEHWEIKRAKFLFREVDDRSVSGEEELLSVSHKTGVTPRREKNVTMFLAESNAGHKLCHPGDVVVNTMWAWMAALGVSAHEGLVSPSYGVYRPYRSGEFLSSYLDELLRTPAYRSEYVVRSTGVTSSRLRLYPEALLRIPFLCPPAYEQNAIVRFLDYVDRRIRRYIRAKQKVIKLLEEQKQALIHRAITRGLDPNVRLKPSGVEWLGDVPEHWTLKRFKSLVRVTSGQVDPRTAEHRTKILIAPNHIESGTGRVVFEETAEQQGADSGKYLVRRGQVIYSKIRPNLRKAAIASLDCLCSADMYPLTIRESELRPQFLLQLLLSVPFTRFVVDCSLRVAMPKVNREALGAGWLWYPDLEEQDAILERAHVSAAPLEAAIGQSRREIALFIEYRTRLVADMVTGRLDVREAAEVLPNEAGEPEPLDDTAAVDANEAADDADLDAAGEEDEA